MSDKFKAPWYTIEKWVHHPEGYNIEYVNGSRTVYHTIERSEDGKLFSRGIYNTNLSADDIPSRFIYARIGKLFGYIDTSRVSDIIISSNRFVNHIFKDDGIYIKFDSGKIEVQDGKRVPDFEQYDVNLWALDAIKFIAYSKYFSGIEIDEYVKAYEDKVIWYNENYKDEHDCMSLEEFHKMFDDYLKKAEEAYKNK